jgi:hypothetical protein
MSWPFATSTLSVHPALTPGPCIGPDVSSVQWGRDAGRRQAGERGRRRSYRRSAASRSSGRTWRQTSGDRGGGPRAAPIAAPPDRRHRPGARRARSTRRIAPTSCSLASATVGGIAGGRHRRGRRCRADQRPREAISPLTAGHQNATDHPAAAAQNPVVEIAGCASKSKAHG